MSGFGPPPKNANERRRRNADTFTPAKRLPPDGRRGPTPAWPLPRPRKAELAVWAQLWATPQAVAWEELAWTRAVARYCRLLVAAEKPDASAATCGEVRQMEDRLGLTPMAMLRLRWGIEAPEQEGAADVVRLKVVDAAAAE